MGAVLRRAAFSPNIKERADCSAALFTAVGRAARPGRAHPRAPRIDARVGARRRSRDRGHAGDEIVLNDPFAGGTHLNDITLVSPCFVDGELVGWVANRAHHADVGGIAPGSMPPDATDDRRGGAAAPADAASTTRSSTGSSTRRARPSNVAATSTRNAAPTGSASSRIARASSRARSASRCSTRSSTTASGACAPRSPSCPTAAGTFDDVLDSAGPRPEQQSPTRIVRHADGRRRRTRRSTSPAPTRSGRATSTRSKR